MKQKSCVQIFMVNVNLAFHWIIYSAQLKRRALNLKSQKQVQEVMQLVMDLSNNVRLWENNGFTPHELHNRVERPMLRPLPDEPYNVMTGSKTRRAPATSTKYGGKKVGRNEPCPCGSGKKYKKCCGG
ncbi:SEC-C metal-binding domain-containing protein [Virgibacillus siamensis]|uniref:SEC-C metal-binding domain-containing protein n=1 Tax=Virgibacillus siamensis TaxID=480071 RepID=UPI0031D53000